MAPIINIIKIFKNKYIEFWGKKKWIHENHNTINGILIIKKVKGHYFSIGHMPLDKGKNIWDILKSWSGIIFFFYIMYILICDIFIYVHLLIRVDCINIHVKNQTTKIILCKINNILNSLYYKLNIKPCTRGVEMYISFNNICEMCLIFFKMKYVLVD